MRYLGGKHRLGPKIAAHITSLIKPGQIYYEPFVGACNIAIHLDPSIEKYLSDGHEDLILMWQGLMDGWQPPVNISEEDYANLRNAEPSALRGFTGFACSFGAKWFGGYARDNIGSNYAARGSRAALSKVKKFRDFPQEPLGGLNVKITRLNNVNFLYSDYKSINIKDNSFVYCDPPYATTTAYKGTINFNHDEFWNWAVDLVLEQDCMVLVSEYQAPDGIEVLDEWFQTASLRHKQEKYQRHEKLFIIR